ncbi:ferredoxin [Nanoarchaeota archaeon]
MTIKIIQDHKECIGCGACVAICPDNWEMDEEGKAKPIKAELDDIGCNQEAADSCPVKCITIKKA